MRTILTAAALAAVLATPALASEPTKLDDRQLDAVSAGVTFAPFPTLLAPVTWGEPTTVEGPSFSWPGTLSVTFSWF